MMGSGKSSIGNLVSKKLDLPFIDIDNLIEEHAGMTISFEEKGESYFRSLEQKITLIALKTNNSVISLGGGGFINEKINKEFLCNHFSFVILLLSLLIYLTFGIAKKDPWPLNQPIMK